MSLDTPQALDARTLAAYWGAILSTITALVGVARAMKPRVKVLATTGAYYARQDGHFRPLGAALKVRVTNNNDHAIKVENVAFQPRGAANGFHIPFYQGRGTPAWRVPFEVPPHDSVDVHVDWEDLRRSTIPFVDGQVRAVVTLSVGAKYSSKVIEAC